MQVDLKILAVAVFVMGQLMSNEWPLLNFSEERVARSCGVWAPAKRPLNTARTERKTPSKPFNIRVEKHLCWAVFWRVFFEEGFFFTAKATSFSWTPNGIWEHLISLRRNSTLIQEKDPPTSSNIYQLSPFPPTEGAGTAADLSWVESMIFSEPSRGFGGIGFRNRFSGGFFPPEKLTWNLKKAQVRKSKNSFLRKYQFLGFYVNLRGV